MSQRLDHETQRLLIEKFNELLLVANKISAEPIRFSNDSGQPLSDEIIQSQLFMRGSDHQWLHGMVGRMGVTLAGIVGDWPHEELRRTLRLFSFEVPHTEPGDEINAEIEAELAK